MQMNEWMEEIHGCNQDNSVIKGGERDEAYLVRSSSELSEAGLVEIDGALAELHGRLFGRH